jgi:hypothetical protein
VARGEEVAGRVETVSPSKGYKDAPQRKHRKKDTDLDPLRQREDFKKLVAELERVAK